MNEQKITPDYYPHDSSQVLAWHERRHEAAHEILTKEGVKGSLTLLLEQRVQQLASSRLVAVAEVQRLTIELEKLRADHDALGNDMDAVCVERDEARADRDDLSRQLEIEKADNEDWGDRVRDAYAMRDAALREVQDISAREKTVRADYEDLVKRLMTEKDRIEKERDEARSQQNADERICAQRDEFRIQRDAAIRERDVARETCDKAHAEIKRLKARIDEMDNFDLEPSRLEIAARIMAGWASNPHASPATEDRHVTAALRVADALITAANKTGGAL